MQSWFTLELNGESQRLEGLAISASLRDFLQAQNFAEAADETVVALLPSETSPRFQCIRPSHIFLNSLDHARVWTSEALIDQFPGHPAVQAALTPLMEGCPRRQREIVATFFDLFYRDDIKTHAQLDDALAHLASSTTQTDALRDAALRVVREAEAARGGNFPADRSALRPNELDSLEMWDPAKLPREPMRGLSYVDGEKRRMHRPETLIDLLKLRREYPGSYTYASGLSFLSELRADHELPLSMISLEAIRDCRMMHETAEAWEIGTAVTLSEISNQLYQEYPELAKALTYCGTTAERNRATLGGTILQAWAGSPLIPLLLSLNARISLLSETGQRNAPLSQFYDEAGRCLLIEGELITKLTLPRNDPDGLQRRGVTKKELGVYSVKTTGNHILTGAFAFEYQNTVISKAWITYSGADLPPVRAREAEAALVGTDGKQAALYECLTQLNETLCSQISNESIGAFQKQLIITLLQKFVSENETASEPPGEQSPYHLPDNATIEPAAP